MKREILETLTLSGFKYYFRLITMDDKRVYLEAFNKLSKSAKYLRFHQPKKTLTEKELDYFLSIDNYNHLAIGVAIKIKNKEYGVGLIRYIRSNDNFEYAEVGLTILDSYQHNGLGTQLYKKLLNEAKKNGIRTLSNHVLNDNNLMMNLLKKFDGISRQQCDGTSIISVTIN